MRKKAYSARLVISSTRLILVLFLGLPATLWAQRQQASWSDLRGLRAGQGIEVIESSMKHHSGEFIDVTDEILTFQEGGSDLSIKRVDIVRVSTSSAPRRGKHALIGLVVGGAIGAGIGAAAGSSGSKTGWFNFNTRGIGALIGVAIGAPSGALVGAVIPARTTVYRAAPGTYHPTTMSR
ncbi:MAG TPA: hypothetical protein VIH75_09455 [Candidatus Sulfotelmatobacter sp.]